MNTRRVIVAGLIASVVMGMLEMVFEAVAGDGFWSPVVFIGATILRGLQSLQPPVGFTFLGVVLGLMGHMMNSAILGLIFAAVIARRIAARGTTIISGAIYGLVVFFVMWNVIIPIVDPVMRNLNPTFFALSHIMWGAALGWFLPAATTGPSLA
jgi:uncharacterized membrane protein YagU involved in acid resistance